MSETTKITTLDNRPFLGTGPVLFTDALSTAGGSSRLTLPVGERDHIQGLLDAAVLLVEYGDYQCPQCRQAHGIVKQLQQQLGNQLCFVFRHFPQPQVHPQSQKAAQTVEIAAAQGKFWQMHDTLIEHQQALDDGSLVEYAVNMELDVSRFLQEMAAHAYANRIDEDVKSGVSSGVLETPAFFINGIRYEGAWERERLLAAVVQAGNFKQ